MTTYRVYLVDSMNLTTEGLTKLYHPSFSEKGYSENMRSRFSSKNSTVMLEPAGWIILIWSASSTTFVWNYSTFLSVFSYSKI